MNIKVTLCGGIRYAVGKGEMDVQLDDGATAGALLDLLHRDYPAFAPLSRLTVMSVNDTLATGAEPLQDGDEVSLLAALAGG